MQKLSKCCLLQCLQIQREEIITKLDFSNTPLSDNFPQIWEHERTLEDLCLNSIRLCSFPPQLFYCQSLRVLNVSNNNLEEIPNAIGTLRQLTNLNISRNFISSLPENLKNCRNITILDLSCNNLQRLPDAISCLVSLQELFLNETYLEFLPANFGRLINLRILELRLNSLLTLPKSMSRLLNLERIDIGGNEFEELPEVIGELIKLRELWIDFNQIRRIPENIDKLQELQHFEANGNLIDNLPNEVSTWHNVEVLSMCSNNLKCLPNTFGSLKSLVTLKCEFCEISELPESICRLERLEELVVSHNQLIRLPTTIGMLRKLRFLFADDNILHSLPDELCCCASLTVLSVSRNKLDDIPLNIGHLTELKVLNLVENCISTLPVSILNMVNLSSLWLSDNQTQPLVPLQYADVSAKTRLTCIMLPQNQQLENDLIESKSNSIVTHPSPLRRLCFANETQTPFKEENSGNEVYNKQSSAETFSDEQLGPRLMRSPTPYPKELRMMSKQIRSTQKMLQKSDLPNVREARIVPNSCIYNTINGDDGEYSHIIKDNGRSLSTIDASFQQNGDFPSESVSFNFQPLISSNNEIMYNQKLSYPTILRYDVNSLMMPTDPYDTELVDNSNVCTTFCNTSFNPEIEITLNDSQTILQSYPQPQQFMTPPPYHIARNYTKKTLQDLSNYDSMRNQKYLSGNEAADLSDKTEIASMINSSAQGENTDNISNFDEQNNILNVENKNNDTELITERSKTTLLNCDIYRQTSTNQRNDSSIETSLRAFDEDVLVKKKAWIFGAHKNPMVKQVTFKQEDDYPSFFIGRVSNQDGIYILSITPNTNASRLLSVYDKLLEVNGHDFTNISLEEAQQKLENTGNLVNIMLSRK